MRTDRTKTPGVFRYVVLGDIHLGHLNTPTAWTIHGLDRYLNSDLIRDVDMVILEGDVFDHLLANDDENIYQIHRWATLLMMRCATYGTQLRIVEGTSSHDRTQCRYFVEQAANANIPVDLHYATTFSIEYNERLDSNFLYVPDNTTLHPDEILKQVKQLLADRGLEKVDFAIMHGAFKYQYNYATSTPGHDEATYLEMVKYFIMIGHVHQPSQYDRILAAGSFDRGSHGDEGAKGMYDVSVREDGTHTITFIENRLAKRYDTINAHGLDTKAVNVAVRKKVAELPKGSAIRIMCNPNDPATGDIKLLSKEFPQFEWKLEVERGKKKKESVADTIAAIDMSGFIPITGDTLLDLLRPELEKHCPDPVTVDRCMGHMAKLI